MIDREDREITVIPGLPMLPSTSCTYRSRDVDMLRLEFLPPGTTIKSRKAFSMSLN